MYFPQIWSQSEQSKLCNQLTEISCQLSQYLENLKIFNYNIRRNKCPTLNAATARESQIFCFYFLPTSPALSPVCITNTIYLQPTKFTVMGIESVVTVYLAIFACKSAILIRHFRPIASNQHPLVFGYVIDPDSSINFLK